jgi:NAD(P)-dependent dehydrogenase (short-subunit alcohol dehydrogenase family)
LRKLENKIALVTGASRGIGKGIAFTLAKDGAIVYITGRSERENETSTLPGTINQTEKEINSAGGKCIAIRCDHSIDEDVVNVFDTIYSEYGKLDILVNSAWGGYEYFSDGTEFWKEKGFWESPISRWDKMFSAGVRAAYFASSLAAKEMGVAYGTSKAATDKMTATMAHELKEFKIPVICLYPGLVRTESVLKNAEHFDLSNSESTEFMGRVISAMISDPNIMKKSGKVLIAAQEAIEYGVKDIDGSQPRPLSADDA